MKALPEMSRLLKGLGDVGNVTFVTDVLNPVRWMMGVNDRERLRVVEDWVSVVADDCVVVSIKFNHQIGI
ncbi:MAG: hypothetical protein IPQ07_44515 [Myxococcales bacterium]|nr:hypothetical protein [Myxococcales bacterium]